MIRINALLYAAIGLFYQSIEGGRYLGLEVKSRRTVVAKDSRALKAAADSLGKAWAGGIVVYQGDEIKKIADPSIWAVPSRRLFMPAE